MKKILIPIDINNGKIIKKLVSRVTNELMAGDAEFHFLTVLPAYSCYEVLASSWYEQPKGYKLKDAEKKLKEITSILHLTEDKKNYHIVEGIPKDEILAFSMTLPADLVIIPSNFPDLSTYFLGSTATAVVRFSKCSVSVIR